MNQPPKRSLELSGRKLELLAQLLAGEGMGQNSAQALSRRKDPRDYSLSSGQRRLWFLDRLESGIHYNDHFNLRLAGPWHVPALEQALAGIIARHEAMRATFCEVEGTPLQKIVPVQPFKLPQLDLQHVSQSERMVEAARLAVEEARRPFDLSEGPPWRFTMLSLADDDHLLLITAHHITTDGWSRGVFLRELGAFYRALAADKPVSLEELPIQYADYAAWQMELLESDPIAQQLEYWKQQLAGAPGFLALPADRPRPAIQSFRGARLPVTLSPIATAALKNLCRRQGVTLFMALLAVLQVLLKRYTGQDDILVGTPVANRPRKELESLIGYFLNTLVMRAKVSDDPEFREFLRRTRETTLGALAHQDLPLEKLIDALQPERNQSYSPLFQVFFVLQNTPMPDLDLPGLSVRPFEIDNGTAKFDLTLSLAETSIGMTGWLEYATDLFDADRMTRLVGHFQTLVEAVTSNPNARLSQLPLLTASEQKEMLVGRNRTEADFPREFCIHELFEEQARRTPDKVAIECNGKQWTFCELGSRANRVAAKLRSLGVGRDTLVGVCMERLPDMIASLLGILKAGGAYVPLDPEYPAERLALILADARANVVVTEAQLVERLRGLGVRAESFPQLVCVDEFDDSRSVGLSYSDDRVARPSSLAYVIFTSGSTGKPKGVQIEHRSVVNFLNSMHREPGLSSEDILVAVTTLSFDIAALELFLPLTVGARVVLAGRETASDGHELVRLLDRCGATVMQATPATWRMLLESGWEGRPDFKILCGGEAWKQELAEQLLPRCGSLWNMYGPTETTIWSAVQKVEKDRPIAIGRPIANTRFYSVDSFFQPVPIGVPGELWIGGEGVARGYLNRPELTSAKFIVDPFCDTPGSRVFRTGDRVRCQADGTLEFIERMDQQVKLRGFRIELGEVESVLGGHPMVRQSVVRLREDSPGDQRLVAYVVPASPNPPGATELRQWLLEKVPDFMVPSAIVILEALPLTPNGKVDRKALPAPSRIKIEAFSSPIAPRDMLEQQLTKIWEKVLRADSVGLRDNFFELGGHSLLAVRLFSEVRKLTGRILPLATLFQAPTLEQMAEVLRKDGWSSRWISLVPIQPGGRRPPFFCIHGGGGNVLLYKDLARHLGPDYPFYGLQSQGLDGARQYLNRVEDMASHYLKEIRELQPEGPYYLGGFCMGGTVAFEMAQQLLKEKEKVAFLGLFDTYNHNGTPPGQSLWAGIRYSREKAMFHYSNLISLQRRDGIAYLRDKFMGARDRELFRLKTKLDHILKGVGLGSDGRGEALFLEVINEQAGYAYKPQLYQGSITIFIPQRNFSFLRDPDKMGWRNYVAGDLQVTKLRVDPGGMFVEPYVQSLASQLRACLDEAHKRSLSPDAWRTHYASNEVR